MKNELEENEYFLLKPIKATKKNCADFRKKSLQQFLFVVKLLLSDFNGIECIAIYVISVEKFRIDISILCAFGYFHTP